MAQVMECNSLVASGSEWTFDHLRDYDAAIGAAAQAHGLETYPVQLEVISAEQMMDAYASVGLPVNYAHWSFGKHFIEVQRSYRRGQMGLAYEIVINSNPCIAYLMEENTLPMQALVIAHAAYGHNAFFKNNYLFQTWTDADAIVDYLVFARDYLRKCEQRHGQSVVEEMVDSCHALMNHGVDAYKRPQRLSAAAEIARQEEREAYLQSQVNDLWRTLPQRADDGDSAESGAQRYPSEPQENLLYFIEKNAPLLEPWQREVVRIVRKLAQYFYPQRQTKVMNEGWACFWHYQLLHDLYDRGQVDDGFMLEVLHSHTNVVRQLPFDSPHYSGINPYALGFSMMREIRRICESPEPEDEEWFPDLAGTPWHESLDFAMRNFKDESFIHQYLSPRMMRELRLFAINDDDLDPELEVSAIHSPEGYRHLRRVLAEQYALDHQGPLMTVWNVDMRGDRSLTLRHVRPDRRSLHGEAREVLRHVRRLWGFPVRIEELDDKQTVVRTTGDDAP